MRVEGERTGHAHVLPGRVYDGVGGRRLVFLERPTTITHQEHRNVKVDSDSKKALTPHPQATHTPHAESNFPSATSLRARPGPASK